jgi:hypothetical protein
MVLKFWISYADRKRFKNPELEKERKFESEESEKLAKPEIKKALAENLQLEQTASSRRSLPRTGRENEEVVSDIHLTRRRRG